MNTQKTNAKPTVVTMNHERPVKVAGDFYTASIEASAFVRNGRSTVSFVFKFEGAIIYSNVSDRTELCYQWIDDLMDTLLELHYDALADYACANWVNK